MSYYLLLILLIIFSIAGSHAAMATDVNLPWESTYNCGAWTQAASGHSVATNCDDLNIAGSWTCGNGSGLEQITANANNPKGGGGLGQRHWKGDAHTENSGSLYVTFAAQPELWIRWYMRYEQGFRVTSNFNQDKMLFIHSVISGTDAIPGWEGTGNFSIQAQGSGGQHRCSSCGWNTVMGSAASGDSVGDGLWHSYEIHLKMDTNGSNGTAEAWIDGSLVLSATNADFGTNAGWYYVGIGSNTAGSGGLPPLNNGRCAYVDFDDIKISTTGYIGPISGGATPDTIPPSAPSGLTVQ